MSKPAKKKVPAVLPLPRKKNPATGRTAQSAREPASTQGEREGEAKEYGIEKDRGREIPFSRTVNGSVTLTCYGCTFEEDDGEDDGETGWLLKVKNGERVQWSICGDGWQLEKGDAARRQLAGMWDDEETRRRWFAVQSITLRPADFYDFNSPCSDGKFLCDILRDFIISGERKQLAKLSRVIEAFHAQSKNETKRWSVARAVGEAARKHDRIPLACEALQCFANAGGDADEKNFRRALKDCGYGWLICA